MEEQDKWFFTTVIIFLVGFFVFVTVSSYLSHLEKIAKIEHGQTIEPDKTEVRFMIESKPDTKFTQDDK